MYVLFIIASQWAEKIGCLAKISPAIMGLTICAAGTSLPDMMVSIIVAKKGKVMVAVITIMVHFILHTRRSSQQ